MSFTHRSSSWVPYFICSKFYNFCRPIKLCNLYLPDYIVLFAWFYYWIYGKLFTILCRFLLSYNCFLWSIFVCWDTNSRINKNYFHHLLYESILKVLILFVSVASMYSRHVSLLKLYKFHHWMYPNIIVNFLLTVVWFQANLLWIITNDRDL